MEIESNCYLKCFIAHMHTWLTILSMHMSKKSPILLAAVLEKNLHMIFYYLIYLKIQKFVYIRWFRLSISANFGWRFQKTYGRKKEWQGGHNVPLVLNVSHNFMFCLGLFHKCTPCILMSACLFGAL